MTVRELCGKDILLCMLFYDKRIHNPFSSMDVSNLANDFIVFSREREKWKIHSSKDLFDWNNERMEIQRQIFSQKFNGFHLHTHESDESVNNSQRGFYILRIKNAFHGIVKKNFISNTHTLESSNPSALKWKWKNENE